jgi:hypothetical protein
LEVSEHDHVETIADLSHVNPINRIFALGKINKILKPYADNDAPAPAPIDVRLLKGFYVNNI